MRLAVVPREQVVIEDTWQVSGLRGTGSQHVRAEGVEVPAAWTCDPMAGEPCVDVTVVRVPAPALVALSVSRVALGIAAGALDDILGLAGDKVPLLAPGPSRPARRSTMTSPRPTPGCAVPARCTTRPSSPSGPTAVSGAAFTNQLRARARLDAAWAVDQAVEVVEFAYRAGGGSALYDSSPLQRRLRDVHAVTQHFIVRPGRVRRGRIGAGRPGAARPGVLTGVLSRYWGCIAALIAVSVAASSSVGLNMRNSVPASISGTCPGAM